ncbi:MAG: multidrug effflux MFS transporter [Alphaproteobacteria bacterium]|nr:multidrug effflux MFS transporter [Alphaproteobacteria bacterium]
MSGAPIPTPTSTPRPAGPPLLILVALTGIPTFSINIFVPSMPGLVAYFATSGAAVQLGITLYLLTIGLGQLFFGPISDRFGRRPVLIAGVAIYMLGSLICVVAPAIDEFLVGRVIQALGGCAGLVLGRAMIRDMHSREKSASVLGYVTMTMAVATALAPSAGAYLDAWQGWRASFMLMSLLGAALLLGVWLRARETLHERAPLPSLGHMLGVYRTILLTPRFQRFGGYAVCLAAGYYAYVAGAPHVVITLFGLTPTQFGAFYLLTGSAYISGNFLAGRLSERIGLERMTAVGGVIAFAAGVALIGFGAADIRHPLVVFGPIALSFLGTGLSQPSALSGALDSHPRYIGAGAGLIGALQLGGGALASMTIGLTEGPTPLPFAILSGGMLVLAYAILLLRREGK